MNGGKSLEDLNSLWKESDYYDGEISPKSFWRYKYDIADAFQIDIDYNTSSKVYELQDIEYIRSNRLLSYILLSHQLPDVCLLIAKHRDKITTNVKPSVGMDNIPIILNAFENRNYIIYHKRDNPKIEYKAAPLHVLINEDRVYLKLRIYNEHVDTLIFLYDICELTLSSDKF